MTASSSDAPSARLALFGDGDLARTLAEAAGRAGMKVLTGTDPDMARQAASIWVLPGSRADAINATGIALAIVVTGYEPAGPAAQTAPVLRLTRPEIAGSLAEITPALRANDTLSDVFAQDALALGYVVTTLAGTREGFAQRTIYSLMIEAMALLGEGVPPAQIEQAATSFGFAQPPLLMIDHLSLGVLDELLHAELHAQSGGGHGHGHEHEHEHHHDHESHDHSHDSHHEHGDDHKHDHGPRHDPGHAHGHAHGESARMPESAVYVLEKMAHGFDRHGASSGYGFYEHEEDGSAELWDGLSVFSRGAKAIAAQDIQDRLAWSFALEAQRCVHEGLLDRADANLASLAGCGFPRATGGVLSWMESMPAGAFTARAAALAEHYGQRFNSAA